MKAYRTTVVLRKQGMTNSVGSVTSSVANLTVVAPALVLAAAAAQRRITG